MIRVASLSLPKTAQTALDKYQREVDSKPTYKTRVKKAQILI